MFGVVRFQLHKVETVRVAVVGAATLRSRSNVGRLLLACMFRISEDVNIRVWHPLDSVARYQLSNSAQRITS